jgi:hypothetical protein
MRYIVIHVASDDHGDVDAVAEPVVRRVIPCRDDTKAVAAAINKADMDAGENWSVWEIVDGKAVQRAIQYTYDPSDPITIVGA